jgi:hypothetical protein
MSDYVTELLSFTAFSIAGTALVAYVIYWTLNDSPISRWLHDSDAVVPSFLSITAFIFGLTISTLAGYSFDRHQSATANLISESGAINTIVNAATNLPLRDRIQISFGLKDYIEAVLEKEWPAISSGVVERGEIAYPELMALSKIINQVAYQANQRSSIENQLESALATIRHDRQVRQVLAYGNENLKKWIGIPISSFLLLLSVGIVHLGSLKAMKVSLSIASLCIETSMIFLFISLSPYRGLNPVQPVQLQESLRMLDALKSDKDN